MNKHNTASKSSPTCGLSMPARRSLSHHDTDQVLSPPLTPALSPFNRSESSPHIYHHPHHSHPRPVSAAPPEYHPYWMEPPQQPHQPRSLSFSDRSPATYRKQPSKQNKHVCTYPQCGWSFKRYEHLKRHMLVHTGERPHICPYPGCGKRFSRSDNFHAHYRTHAKKQLQQHSQPQKPDMMDPGLSHHSRTLGHDPMEKRGSILFDSHHPHSQPPSSSGLQHQHHHHHHYTYPPPPTPPTHTNAPLSATPPPPLLPPPKPVSSSSVEYEKQHVCSYPQCQRRFKRLEHLKRHMRIHTLERPFPCTYAGCQKAFSRSDNLTQHLKTHERRGSRYVSTPPATMHSSETLSFADFIRPVYSTTSTSTTTTASPDKNHHHHHHHQPTAFQNMLPWQQHPGDAAAAGSIGC